MYFADLDLYQVGTYLGRYLCMPAQPHAAGESIGWRIGVGGGKEYRYFAYFVNWFQDTYYRPEPR